MSEEFDETAIENPDDLTSEEALNMAYSANTGIFMLSLLGTGWWLFMFLNPIDTSNNFSSLSFAFDSWLKVGYTSIWLSGWLVSSLALFWFFSHGYPGGLHFVAYWDTIFGGFFGMLATLATPAFWTLSIIIDSTSLDGNFLYYYIASWVWWLLYTIWIWAGTNAMWRGANLYD